MSGSSTPGPKPAKTMSSRLLTMKFMQRAAASSSSTAVEEPETPSPKRQRLSTTTTTTSGQNTPNSDLEAVQAALAAEEKKRQEAISRQAAEAGESNWVLDFANPTPTSVGAGNSSTSAYPAQPMIVADDSLDAENQGTALGGRKSYGNYRRKQGRDMFDNTESDLIDPSDPQQIEALMKQAQKKTKKQEVRLDKLTSISGGRGSTMIDPRSKGNGKKKHGGKSGKKRSK